MAIRRFVVPLAVSASGALTTYTPYFSGMVHSLQYVKGSFASTPDFTVTVDGTAESVWAESNVTASATRKPRTAVHTATGAAAVYDSASGGAPVLDRIAVANDRIKIVVAQGGVSKEATLHVTVDG